MNERQKRKILVVDDKESDCNLISQTLEGKGFEVIIVLEPKKAVDEAKQIKPALIIMGSFYFKSFNGLKASISIHSVESLKEVPIIIITYHPGLFNSQNIVSTGIVDVLVRPLNIDELVFRTLKILGGNIAPSESTESIIAKSELLGTLKAEVVEPKKHANRELDKDWIEKDHKFLRKPKKSLTKRHPLIYIVVLILFGFGTAGTLFFTDTGEELLNTFLKESSEKNETVEDDTITETISIDDSNTKEIFTYTAIDKSKELTTPAENTFLKEPSEKNETVEDDTITETISIDDSNTKEIVPSAAIVESKKAIIPATSTINKEAFPKKLLLPEKPRALEKIIYSVHVGVFLREDDAFSLIDKFKQKGYDAFIRKVLRTDKKTIYRVLIGKFDNKNKALEQSKIIRQKESLGSFVYHY